MWGIAITWGLASLSLYVNFYILISFSETTGPIGTKLGRYVHWKVPNKVYVFVVDQKYTIETRVPKVSKRVCPYMGINYLLFICFWWWFFLMHSWRKSLSETCIPYYVTFCFWHKRDARRELKFFFFNNQLSDTGSGLDLMF